MSTLKEFVGANSTSAGIPGLVPAAEIGKTNLFLSSEIAVINFILSLYLALVFLDKVRQTAMPTSAIEIK